MAVVTGKGSMEVNRDKSATTDQKRKVGKDGEGDWLDVQRKDHEKMDVMMDVTGAVVGQ